MSADGERVTDAGTIVVGGGPAGSVCAAALAAAGHDVVILDAGVFPAGKPCAGWITPTVLELLGVTPADYPHPLTTYRGLRIHAGPLRLSRRTRQFAVRRCEFDPWLRERAGVPVIAHRVRRIERLDPGRHDGRRFLVDGRWRCRWLVGAGGTACPVRRALFPDRDRGRDRLVTALEAEYRGAPGTRLHPDVMELWFRLPGLDGYAWLLPKRDGWLNVGLGGAADGLTGGRLQALWERFAERLVRRELLREPPPAPRGYAYRLQPRGSAGHRPALPPARDGAVLAGDAAGLATADLGEGIGPAIASGRWAAAWILSGGAVPARDRAPAPARWSLPGGDGVAGRLARWALGC